MVKISQKWLACLTAVCFALSAGHAGTPGGQPQPPASPPAFPSGDYTPHGYIDNPYHSLVANRSGVVRTFPPLGFGWWRTEAVGGGYGWGDRDHVNYLSLLRISVATGTHVFAGEEDFSRSGVRLSSSYHTKHILSYDWHSDSLAFSLKCFLVNEHALGCFLRVTNERGTGTDVRVDATHICRIGATQWWGSDGLTARYVPERDASVSKIWAYGDVFALAGSLRSTDHMSTASNGEWDRWIRENVPASVNTASLQGRGPLLSVQRYRLTIDPHGQAGMLVVLCRGHNESETLVEVQRALADAPVALGEQLAEDREFWTSCPVLTGGWPDSWRHGWVYDFETLRMTVRRPIGIFSHPWDGMQVHSPRMVLGETSLDMMTLGYGAPALAREVFYGTFADALASNVPCAREDGSVNMISSDGSECGTAPMWGYPLHMLRALFAASQDTAWLAVLYPHLAAYAEWWLDHRTDAEGWLHCNNSWESGQDGSRRFLVAEKNEGAVADFVRTVDVESSMAEGLGVLAGFARVLGKNGDAERWNALAARRVGNTRSMFTGGSFHDVDGRTRKPIVLNGYDDVMMLAPVTCGVATDDQIRALQPKFSYFLEHPRHGLEWPPLLFTFAEAAWNAGQREAAARAVADAATRTYARTDARTVIPSRDGDPFSYRIPGVANEYWPVGDVVPGSENYGWGATLPMFIIRNIVGFREAPDGSAQTFLLGPCLPASLPASGTGLPASSAGLPAFGSPLGITNLRFGRLTFDLSITRTAADTIQVSLRPVNESKDTFRVIDRKTGREVASWSPGSAGPVVWKGTNGTVYEVGLER